MLYAKEFIETKSSIKIHAVCPGYCKTAFNAYTGHTDPADGARVAVNMALLTDPGATAAMHCAAHMPAHFQLMVAHAHRRPKWQVCGRRGDSALVTNSMADSEQAAAWPCQLCQTSCGL